MEDILIFIAGLLVGYFYSEMTIPNAVKHHFDKRKNNNLKQIIWINKEDAQNILNELKWCIRHYGFVTIGDYYDCMGCNSEFTDYQYGWNDLSEARIEERKINQNGFTLKLPNPIQKEKNHEK